MDNIIVWAVLVGVGIILGTIHYAAGYNIDLPSKNTSYKFLEFFRYTISYLIALAIGYYFWSTKGPYVTSKDFDSSDIFLGLLFLVAIFGWLPYFVKNFTEGITVIFKKFLG